MNYTTHNQLNLVLSKLENPTKTSPGQWAAPCPAHDDHKPSLAVSLGREGQVIAHCHGGCEVADVLAAIGMEISDLYPSNATAKGRDNSCDARIVAEYDYCDAEGSLRYQVVRTEPKDFRLRSPKQSGGWQWNIAGVKRVPYHLPELVAADPKQTIFIVEGEKDVDRLRSIELVATCNAMGAGKWTDELSPFLGGRHVVILPDNDSTGHRHAHHVAASLSGIAASIKVVELPGLATKGDVSDWLDDGSTKEDLLRIVDGAGHWVPGINIEPPLDGLVCLAEVQSKEVEWLWPGRIPLAKLTLLAGDPGLGKSFVSLSIAAAVSNGSPWPDNPMVRQPAGGVVLLSAEDDMEDTVRPRLDAHSADCKRIKSLTKLTSLKEDIERLRKAVDQTTGCRLVIVDPISAYLGGTDSHNNADVRAVLTPLAELAAEKRVAIVAVTHLRKSEGSAINRSMGSLGFIAAARAGWLICRDSSDPERRLMLSLKNNLARDAANGLAYRIESDEPQHPPTIRWEPEALTITADEALSVPAPKRRGPKKDEVLDWLPSWIAGRGGRIMVRQLQQDNRQFPKADDAEEALLQLVELGHGYWEHVPATSKGGRPTRYFVLNQPSTSTEPSETTAA